MRSYILTVSLVITVGLLGETTWAAQKPIGPSIYQFNPGATYIAPGSSVQPSNPSTPSGGSHCTPGPDRDGDCVADANDNCPFLANADQADSDWDHVGNACDGDWDSDGTTDEHDNCWDVPNADQGDIDGDHAGDACDIDRDGDGYTNGFEPTVGTDPNKWDTDGDNVSDSSDCDKLNAARALAPDCDMTDVVANPPPPPPTPDLSDPFGDDDGDGTRNGLDNCVVVYNPGQQDINANGIGDACENVIGGVLDSVFVKGGGGPGANCTLITSVSGGSSLPIALLIGLPSLLMAVLRKRS